MRAAAVETEQFRLECEARDWLRRGYTTPQRVDELMERVSAKRGGAAAERLREEMRRQWRLQHGQEGA